MLDLRQAPTTVHLSYFALQALMQDFRTIPAFEQAEVFLNFIRCMQQSSQ